MQLYMVTLTLCYFSAYPTLKADIDAGKLPWSTEKAITLYDQVAEAVDSTFPDMMQKSFHCPKSRSDVIAAGREIVAKSDCILLRSVMRHLVV